MSLRITFHHEEYGSVFEDSQKSEWNENYRTFRELRIEKQFVWILEQIAKRSMNGAFYIISCYLLHFVWCIISELVQRVHIFIIRLSDWKMFVLIRTSHSLLHTFSHWISKHFNHGITLILSLTILFNALFFQHFRMFMYTWCPLLNHSFHSLFTHQIILWLNHTDSIANISMHVRSSFTFIHMLSVQCSEFTC